MVMVEKATGFASPAQGYEARGIDFNQLLITHPAATFIMQAASGALSWRGIMPGSLLVVDRAVKPQNGSVVVFSYDGEFLCREMVKKRGKVSFTDGESELELAGEDFLLFGTVTGVITKLC